MATNKLYYGDNLHILRHHIPPESVDLIYLDPPFNSERAYSVLFKDDERHDSAAQVKAFEDFWEWDDVTEAHFKELTGDYAPEKLAGVVRAMREFLGATNMAAYLVMMAVRLVEMRRVLKPTGTIYLHCDPTASHYLKLVLDAVFSPENFRNEIVWCRTASKGLMTRKLPQNHDVILCYSKTDDTRWNGDAMFVPYDHSALDDKTIGKYCHVDSDGRRYQLDNLLNPNHDRPNLTYEFLGVTRVWRWTKERMQEAYDKGLVIQTKPGHVPRFKRYLDEQRGRPVTDVWNDIPPLNSQASERLGYPTQKPVALLERIIAASSNPGDVVLDPFCGCGTTVEAAQRLGRRWIGIDITHLALSLIRRRLETYPNVQVDVDGEPEDLAGARKLAKDDPYQFQWWALGRIGARPTGDFVGSEGKRGADRGIDGVMRFRDSQGGPPNRIVIQVKGGERVSPSMIRDLRGTMERDGAKIGVFLTLTPPTEEMVREARAAGRYTSPTWNRDFPRLQILTAEQILAGAKVEYPGQDVTLKVVPSPRSKPEQLTLPERPGPVKATGQSPPRVRKPPVRATRLPESPARKRVQK